MEPDAEIKFARVYTRAEFKFRPCRGVCKDKISRSHALFVKDTAAKTRPPFSYAVQALSRIGATLDKIRQR
ncbi:hypothetical protein [uncultured Campylobacter sp.]|uniref:hypothetical protein n=1 Tax=uncultured Campylobacter sp. TaxID=218934 RepID=UPI00262EA896|nr:hypothetical protein [uncultured Campylobacter sp.]